MRPKIVIAILFAAAVVVIVAVALSKSSRASNPQPNIVPAQIAAISSNPVPAVSIASPAPVKPLVALLPANNETNNVESSEEKHEEYVQKRADDLMELAMQSSPAAHQQIIEELKNPDKEIRRAALDALEQADDRSVVPQMQQIADQTDDPQEKQEIEDSIDFINLPSLTEYIAQQKAKHAASGNQTSSQPPGSK